MNYFSLVKNKFILGALICAFPFGMHAQYTKKINSNRPSLSMGAYSVGENVVQLEGGYTHHESYSDDTDQLYKGNTIDLDFRMGAFFEQLEFLAQINFHDGGYPNQKLSGFQSVELGTKLLLFDSYKNYQEKINIYSWKANQRYKFRRLVPTVAMYAGYQFHFAKNHYLPVPKGGSRVALITQQHLSKKWTLVTNWYAENLKDELYTTIGYYATLSLMINTRSSIFAENQGKWYQKETYNIPFKQTNTMRLGATYLVTPNIQVDLHGAHTLQAVPDRWQMGFGVSWRNQRETVWKDPYENINP